MSRLRQDFPVTKERSDSNLEKNLPRTRQTLTTDQQNSLRLIHEGGSRLAPDEELEPKIGLFGFKNEKYIWPE